MKTTHFAIAALALLALTVSASATFVPFTDTAQLDTASIAKDAMGNPIGGYAVHLNSGNANLFVDGLHFQADQYYPAGFTEVALTGFGRWSENGVAVNAVTGPGADKMNMILNEYAWGASTFRFDVVNGQQYKLQIINTGHAFLGGPQAFDVNVSATPGLDGDELTMPYWTNSLYTQTFTANANTVDISLGMGSSTGDPYPMTTALILTPVPEPATMSLLALGGLALLRRRK